MRDIDDLTSALLTSDLSLEIRAEFMEHIGFGLSASDATTHALGRFGQLLTSPDDGPVMILSIAALQLRQDQLSTTFRDAALDLIESGEALAAYRVQEEAAKRERRDLLARFAEALTDAKTCD